MIRYIVFLFAILSLILSVISEIVPLKPCEGKYFPFIHFNHYSFITSHNLLLIINAKCD